MFWSPVLFHVMQSIFTSHFVDVASYSICSAIGQWLQSHFSTCWPRLHLCQCLKILLWPVCWQMILNESICGVSSPAIGWILRGHPTCLTPGNHDESASTAAPDCFLTFNSVSSCAWMNIGRVMDFWSNVLQQVGRRAPVSHGNYGGLDQYSRSSPPHNPHTSVLLFVVQPLIRRCALWFCLLWSTPSPVPKCKDRLRPMLWDDKRKWSHLTGCSLYIQSM